MAVCSATAGSTGGGQPRRVAPTSGRGLRLRDELDAQVAHLYGLSRDDFEHILGTFPLVFPDDAEGEARKDALLAVYDRFAGEVKDWARE